MAKTVIGPSFTTRFRALPDSRGTPLRVLLRPKVFGLTESKVVPARAVLAPNVLPDFRSHQNYDAEGCQAALVGDRAWLRQCCETPGKGRFDRLELLSVSG